MVGLRRPARRAVSGTKPVRASWRLPCGTPMLLALMLWVCSLLLVMIFVAPFFGGRVASIAGLGLLVFFVLACRAICAIRVDPGKE